MAGRYLRFTVMILTATVIMHGVMLLNIYSLRHVYLRETRPCTALPMGATMAALMGHQRGLACKSMPTAGTMNRLRTSM